MKTCYYWSVVWFELKRIFEFGWFERDFGDFRCERGNEVLSNL